MTFLKMNKRGLWSSVILACLLMLSAVTALAGDKGSVSRIPYDGETHVGLCCSLWADPVTVVEGEKLAPIVVTWSSDYRANAPFVVGLKLNGGPCVFNGPAHLEPYTPAPQNWIYKGTTLQWVIMPGDYKLQSGPNEIRVCGGGIFNSTDTIVLGFSTLTARVQK